MGAYNVYPLLNILFAYNKHYKGLVSVVDYNPVSLIQLPAFLYTIIKGYKPAFFGQLLHILNAFTFCFALGQKIYVFTAKIRYFFPTARFQLQPTVFVFSEKVI